MISEIFLIEAVVSDDKLASVIGKKWVPEIIDAIKNKRVVEVTYQGAKETSPGAREIEPSALGIDKHGKLAVRAWQRSGATVTGIDAPPITKGWKWFLVDRMSRWNDSSNKNFTKARPKYNHKGDEHMSIVYANADFGKVYATSDKPTKIKRFDKNRPTRNPNAVVKDFGKFDTSKDRKIAISPEVEKEYNRTKTGAHGMHSMFASLQRIAKKMSSDNTLTYIDISDMTPDEVKKFSSTRIIPSKGLRESFELYDAGYRLVTRLKTLRELMYG